MSGETIKDWLRNFCVANPPGTRVPTDRQLGRMWNLSERTVRRILRTLRQAGLVYRVRGKGTFVGKTHVPSIPAALPPSTSAEKLAESYESLIRSGEYKIGDTLPSVKYSRTQFRVTPATVIAAYRLLEKRRMVVKVGRAYRIGRFANLLDRRRAKRIELFLFSPCDEVQLYSEDFLAPAYRKMELELLKHGFSVRSRPAKQFCAAIRDWKSQRTYPLGVIAAFVERDMHDEMRSSLEDLARLGGQNRCRALVVGDSFHDCVKDVSYLDLSSVTSTLSHALARYICDQGFAHVRFFFDERRGGGRTFASHMKTMTELRRACSRAVFCVVVKSVISGETADQFVERMAEIHGMSALIHVKDFEHVSPSETEHALVAVDDFATRFSTSPGRSLWLFSHDAHAAAALTHARNARMRVPDDPSIMGFENNPDSCALGLSSCTPDFDTMGHQMAHALIGDYEVEKTEKGYIKTQALLLHRLTTAAAQVLTREP